MFDFEALEKRVGVLEQGFQQVTQTVGSLVAETRSQTVILRRLDEAEKKDKRTMDGARTWVPRLCFLQKLAVVAMLAGAGTFGTWVVTKMTNTNRQIQKIGERVGVPAEEK